MNLAYIHDYLRLVLLVPILLSSLLFSSLTLAQQSDISTAQEKKNVSQLSALAPVAELSIDPQLISLINLLNDSEHDQADTQQTITRLSDLIASYNYAEQCLLLIAKALTAKSNQQYVQATELFQSAEQLFEHIPDAQLSAPIFSQLHHHLAQLYAEQTDYQQAFLQRREYLKKYQQYRKSKRQQMIDSLKQNIEVEKKVELNEILISQNERKARRIAEQQAQKQQRRYNFIAILATAFVFILLLFRQVKVRNKLLQLTKIDALTQVYNRNTLFEQGHKLIADFANKPSDFTVLLLDLDHFKKINDNFGHHIGDQVLVKCAQLVGETMRSRDVFARIGGEEFAALLPYADYNKAKAIAERINEKISQASFDYLPSEQKVTVSIGLASMTHSNMSFDELIHCADLAMYQAKEQGRNCVVSYNKIAHEQERRSQDSCAE